MCDVLDRVSYIADRRRTARHRRCRACGEAIARGQFYVRIVWFDSREASAVVQCERCHAMFRALQKLRPGEPIAFDLDCGDYLEDPEHPLQWLAFALPPDAEIRG